MTSIRFLLLSIFAVAVSLATPLWDAVDPEQVLFIASRCMEDWSPKAKDPKKALENWMNWKLQPSDDQATHCYTKCMLEKIGFYDFGEKKFKGVRVVQQWETYHQYQSADREKVLALADEFNLIKLQKSFNCTAVFNAYKDVHAKYLDTIKAILFGDRSSAEKFYKAKGDTIKQKGQSLFVFCENINYPAGSAKRKQELCKIRKYELSSGKEFSNHMACIFKGLRYLNKKNELNAEEIVRDLQLVGKKPNAMKATLQKCKGNLKETDPGAIAIHYYKCLLDDPKVVDDFKEAFDYREIRSQDYMSLLRSSMKPYEKSEVRKMVDKIDDKQCS
ncbi:long form salivary protein D7L1-like [Ochlerotatus camptorhynchus]|uniref:long form salivary protein D7L1-like n=1 Tax=Ochlerotatus camptorhynchus TaxID=644619 RepID=UPI0031D5C14B